MRKVVNNTLYNGKRFKVIGVARLRQIRVLPVPCYIVEGLKEELPDHKCYHDFEAALEDVGNYAPNWHEIQKHFKFDYVNEYYWRATQPWWHKTAWTLETTPYFGELAVYPGSGFEALLARTKPNSRIVLEFLEKYNWFDRATKALFIELTLYNVDANMFTIITICIETSSYGLMMTSQITDSSKLLVLLEDLGFVVIAGFVVYLLMTFHFILKIFMKAFKSNIKNYFMNFWNIVDTAIVILSLVTIVLYFKRNAYILEILAEVERSKSNGFVSFYIASLFDRSVTYLSGLLITVATIRLWKILQIFYLFRIFSLTLSRSLTSLLSITLFMACSLVGFCLIISIVNGEDSELFYNQLKALTSVTALSFGFSSNLDPQTNLIYGGKFMGVMLYMLLMVVINLYLMNMFITIVCVYWSIIKNEEKQTKRKITVWEYLSKQLAESCNCIKRRRHRKKAIGGDEDTNDFDLKMFQDIINSQFDFLEKYVTEKNLNLKDFQEFTVDISNIVKMPNPLPRKSSETQKIRNYCSLDYKVKPPEPFQDYCGLLVFRRNKKKDDKKTRRKTKKKVAK